MIVVCGGLVSMRKSALTVYGGELHSLWDTPRWESGRRSRCAAHVCRKDWQASGRRGYKPWQTTEIMGLSEALASNDPQLMDWQDFCWETPSIADDYVITQDDLWAMKSLPGDAWEEIPSLPVGWDEDSLVYCHEPRFDRWNSGYVPARMSVGFRQDDQQEYGKAYNYHRVAGIVAGDIEPDSDDEWLFFYIPKYNDETWSDSMNDPDLSDDSDIHQLVLEVLQHFSSPTAKNARSLDLSIEEYQALCEPCLEDVLF